MDANPIFDIGTSTDIASCSGDACKAAAKAVMDYQRMLGHVTAMRWGTSIVAQGIAAHRSTTEYTVQYQVRGVVRGGGCCAFSRHRVSEVVRGGGCCAFSRHRVSQRAH